MEIFYSFPARSSASRRLFFHYGVHPSVLFLRAKRQVLLFSQEGFVYPPDLPRVVFNRVEPLLAQLAHWTLVGGVGSCGAISVVDLLRSPVDPLSAFLGSHPPIAAVGGLGRVSVTAGTALMLDRQRQATS